MRHRLLAMSIFGTLILMAACGPSDEKIQRLADERIATALAAIPTATLALTVTPQPTPTIRRLPPSPTPQPTSTPQPTATPQPTPTPFAFPPTATPSPSGPAGFNTIYNSTWPSVFYVETPSGNGTGWLIEPGLILTAQHIVDSVNAATIRQSVAPPFVAFVIGRDIARDIALLQFVPEQVTLDPRAHPLPIRSLSGTDTASPLLALGYSGADVKPDGTVGSASANAGILSQIINLGDGRGANLVLDAAVDPGDSGGPVLDAGGSVVGMTRATQEYTDSGQRVLGTVFAIHMDVISEILPLLKRGVSP